MFSSQLWIVVMHFLHGINVSIIESILFSHIIDDHDLAPPTASPLVHIYLCIKYLSMIVAAYFVSHRMTVPWGIIVFSIIELVGSVVLYTSMLISYRLELKKALASIGLIFMSVSFGGKTRYLHQMLLNEFHLPLENPQWRSMKLITEIWTQCGKFYGYSLTSFLPGQGSPYYHLCTIFYLMNELISIGVTIMWIARHSKNIKSRDIVGDFIKHNIYSVRYFLRESKFVTDKRNEFTAEDVIKLKQLYKVILLFGPVMILMGLIDQKFTLYIDQASEMDGTTTADYSMRPSTILLLYPVMICCLLPIFVHWVIPSLSRFLTWTPSRNGLAGFFFVALSLLAATVLESRVEASKNVEIVATTAYALIFNTVPCELKVSVLDYSMNVSANHHGTLTLERRHGLMPLTVEAYCDESDTTHVLQKDTLFNTGVVLSYLITWDSNKNLSVISLGGLGKNGNELKLNDKLLRVVYCVDRDIRLSIRSMYPSEPNIDFVLTPNDHVLDVDIGKGNRRTIFLNNVLKDNLLITKGTSNIYTISTDRSGAVHTRFRGPRSLPIHMLYQIPQTIFLGICDVLMATPGYVFCQNKVPVEWEPLLDLVWFASAALGNLFIAGLVYLQSSNRRLMVFSEDYALSIFCSIAMIHLLLKQLKTEYSANERVVY